MLRGGTHAVACHLPPEDRKQIFEQDVFPNL
jgi:peptide/nickel transport system ATP-binding protein